MAERKLILAIRPGDLIKEVNALQKLKYARSKQVPSGVYLD